MCGGGDILAEGWSWVVGRKRAFTLTGGTEDIGCSMNGASSAWDAIGGRGATGAFLALYNVEERMEGFADLALFIWTWAISAGFDDIVCSRNGASAAWDTTGGRGATWAFWALYKVEERMEGFADLVHFIWTWGIGEGFDDIVCFGNGAGAAWDTIGGKSETGAFWALYKVEERMEGLADLVLFIWTWGVIAGFDDIGCSRNGAGATWDTICGRDATWAFWALHKVEEWMEGLADLALFILNRGIAAGIADIGCFRNRVGAALDTIGGRGATWAIWALYKVEDRMEGFADLFLFIWTWCIAPGFADIGCSRNGTGSVWDTIGGRGATGVFWVLYKVEEWMEGFANLVLFIWTWGVVAGGWVAFLLRDGLAKRLEFTVGPFPLQMVRV